MRLLAERDSVQGDMGAQVYTLGILALEVHKKGRAGQRKDQEERSQRGRRKTKAGLGPKVKGREIQVRNSASLLPPIFLICPLSF